jgi:hypothetical protein
MSAGGWLWHLTQSLLSSLGDADAAAIAEQAGSKKSPARSSNPGHDAICFVILFIFCPLFSLLQN